jgi:hypothetical protein
MRLQGGRIAGFMILMIGVILSVLLLSTLVRDIPVWFLGRKVFATIEETWYENLSDDEYFPAYFFRYRFTTSDGEVVVGSSRVPEDEFMGYQAGSEIMVKYSPLNPSNNRLDDSRLMPFLLCSYIPFILICSFAVAAGREMIFA